MAHHKIEFGTGGFRGVIAEDFTKENIQLIAEALARLAIEENSDQTIVVGYDYRFLSDRAAGWVAEVLAAHNIHVLLYNRAMPTPAIMYATKDLNLNYGAMITASHNPYYFNGIKLFQKGGMDADVEFTGSMEKMIRTVDKVCAIDLNMAKTKGLVTDYNNLDRYIMNIKGFISNKIVNNHAKILFDNLCGVGAVGLKTLADIYNIKQFDIRNSGHDAFFNFSLPNPTREMMKPLANVVVREGYDFAMATDSDGDRLGILDEKGRYVDSNDILGALYYYLVRYRGEKGDVVKNCATSLLLDKLADKLGYTCHEVDVGFKNISSKMTEVDALIGGESSGGLTMRGYVKGKDSVFSASLFMEMVILMDKPVSEIMSEVHAFADYGMDIQESTIELATLDGVEKFLQNKAPVLSEKVVRTLHFGRNFKFLLDEGWALLRLSGTEPAVRVFAETKNGETTKKLIGELKKSLEKFAG